MIPNIFFVAVTVVGRRVLLLLRLELVRGFRRVVRRPALPSSASAGVAAEAACVIKLGRRPSSQEARKAGAQLAKAQAGKDLLVLAGSIGRADEIALGLALRGYDFDTHKSAEKKPKGKISFMVAKPEAVAKSAAQELRQAAEPEQPAP